MLRLDFGEGALKEEDKGALFKVIGNVCNKLFGQVDLSRSLRETTEIFNVNGEYAKISRQTIRNLGCVIGTLVWVEYFNPTEEVYNEQIAELYDDEDDEDDDDNSFVGRYVTMSFDSTDGSFYKTDALAKLRTDDEGTPELEELGGYYEEDIEDDAFGNLLDSEARTLTIDDYFTINTVRLILEKKTL